MADYLLPELGDGIDEGQVAAILVSVGDTINEGDSVLELETGKSAVEVPTDISGTIKEIKIAEGDTIKPGDLILVLDAAESAVTEQAPAEEVAVEEVAVVEEAPAPIEAAPAASLGPVDYKLPDLGDGIDEGQISAILVAVGDTLNEGDSVLELETGKSAVEVPTDISGTVTEIKVSEGDTIKPGDTILVIDAVASAASAEETPAVPEPVKEETAAAPVKEAAPEATPVNTMAAANTALPSTANVPAAPSTRRFSREIGIKISNVPGSGPAGRISIDDIKAYCKKLNEARDAAPSLGGAIAARPLPDFSQFGSVTAEKMSKIRELTAEHMAFCWNSIPHVTQYDKSNITEIEGQRKALSARIEKQGGSKLTVTAILVKIVASALKKFPNFNASIDPAGKQIIIKDYINIGIAVDTPKGLVVPVIKDADKKNILEITNDMAEISTKARAGKLTVKDMSGGTFTISNLGGIGGTNFTPIVNWPEVAILGVSRGTMESVWNGSAFEPRLMMPLALSYDHRVIDGADGARFTRWICDVLENPILMQLEG